MKLPMFLTKEKWRIVKTIVEVVQILDGPSRQYNFYLHLYESNKGNRKCVVNSTIPKERIRSSAYMPEQLDIYQNKIHRWVNGRYDPDILSYNQVPEEDTANALRGTIS